MRHGGCKAGKVCFEERFSLGGHVYSQPLTTHTHSRISTICTCVHTNNLSAETYQEEVDWRGAYRENKMQVEFNLNGIRSKKKEVPAL